MHAVEGRGVPRWSSVVVACAAVLALLAAQASQGLTPPRAVDADAIALTARVNVGTTGAQADGASFGAVLSAGGRHVAFVSGASTLVSGDRNGTRDVFVRDLRMAATSRVSVSSTGTESDGPSEKPSLSADGSIVAFPSSAANLVAGDANGLQDVFVHDRITGTTERVSEGHGREANGPSLASLVSADGSVVVYSSAASNLVPGDLNGALDVFAAERASRRTTRVSIGEGGESTDRSEASSIDASGRIVGFRSYAPNLVRYDWNGLADVFVRDRRRAATERVNVSTLGAEADAVTFRGMLSGDGRFVGFRSRARDLVPQDTNDALDVFVHDRLTGLTTRVSVSSDGAQADARGLPRPDRWSLFMSRPFLSANGRFAAFTSRAPNLVSDDRNGHADVFVHDLWTRRTVRVSLTEDGMEANGDSCVSGISADGRVVAFTSLADNIVAGDTNGRRDVFVVRLRRGATSDSEADPDPGGGVRGFGLNAGLLHG
jgi:Tol biopolymer transport system component